MSVYNTTFEVLLVEYVEDIICGVVYQPRWVIGSAGCVVDVVESMELVEPRRITFLRRGDGDRGRGEDEEGEEEDPTFRVQHGRGSTLSRGSSQMS